MISKVVFAQVERARRSLDKALQSNRMKGYEKMRLIKAQAALYEFMEEFQGRRPNP